MKKDFVNKNEASQILGISRPTLDSWIKRGIIKKYMIGLSPYLKISEIKRVLDPLDN